MIPPKEVLKQYLETQFATGRNKGMEHRKIIGKIWKKLYNRADFHHLFVDMNLWGILMASLSMLGILAVDMTNGAFIINPNPLPLSLHDINLIKILAFLFGVSLILILLSFVALILSAFQGYSRYQIRQIIKKYHIDTIK